MWNFEDVKEGRGETPEDINEQVQKICGRFLAGAWSVVEARRIQVKRISGGLLNQIYRCQLPEDVHPFSDEPSEVAIRLYYNFPKEHAKAFKPTRTDDLAVALLAGERGLGPAIYGLFDEGEIHEFIRSHWFTVEDQNDPKMLALLARQLAKFNSMKMPMEKFDGSWLFDWLRQFYLIGYEKFDIDEIIKRHQLKTIKNTDILAEIDWLERLAGAVQSPVVFCHNDVIDVNILVRDSHLDGRAVKDEEKIVFVDFEWSRYGLRGFDLAFVFADWGRTKSSQPAQLAPDQAIKWFIEAYVSEYAKINGDWVWEDQRNRIDNMVKEVKVFFLIHLFRLPMLMTLLEEISANFNKDKMMITGEQHLNMYFAFKKQFLEAKSIPVID